MGKPGIPPSCPEPAPTPFMPLIAPVKQLFLLSDLQAGIMKTPIGSFNWRRQTEAMILRIEALFKVSQQALVEMNEDLGVQIPALPHIC